MNKLPTTLFLSFLILMLSVRLIGAEENVSYTPVTPVSLEKLNETISKAQGYYHGLYTEVEDGAVVAEYYPKIKYTVRHATIGGAYYYDYINDATKAASLRKVVTKYGFKEDNDQHSFIWKKTTLAPREIVYNSSIYRDCTASMKEYGSIAPYRSKVCSLGEVGVRAYTLVSRLDTFAPLVDTLHRQMIGDRISLEEWSHYERIYNRLGYGIPVCMWVSCSKTASTIRSSHFGEIALRTGRMQYADSVAHYLVKAQNREGAFYISYDKEGKRRTEKSIAYYALDRLFNDPEAYQGDIITNVETMNNALAFLLHYRCERYNSGCSR